MEWLCRHCKMAQLVAEEMRFELGWNPTTSTTESCTVVWQVEKSKKLKYKKITHFRLYCKPTNTTFSGFNFVRVLLHKQNKINAKKLLP